MLYSAPQLRLLVVIAALFLAGLGVREWRAGFPDLADRLERFDREEPLTPLVPPVTEPRPVAPRPRPAKLPRGNGDSSQADTGVTAPAPSVSDPRPLDLNRATVGEIARLPGVGTALAQRIIDERERRGRFDSPDALRQVMGLGPKKLAAIRDLVTVGE